MTDIRKGQVAPFLSREAFRERFHGRFYDPAFEAESASIERLEKLAWEAYHEGRKAPRAKAAGGGFADPGYELSDEWRATHELLQAAQQRWSDPNAPSRILVVNGSARNDGTCPGEVSKSWRLSQWVCETVQASGMKPELLDLSLVTSEYGRQIHPCKGCVSSAMPLCHWPCSCYPNHALGQVHDWMAEIYQQWVSAHGIVLVAPTYWYQSPSPLKLMIDRLVCADGGNPDPTTTHGKKVAEAKAIEAKGWDYPKHLAGRVYGLVVHGDVAGVEVQRRNLSDWLDWMGLVDAGSKALLDRYVGYYGPYYDSHKALDNDEAFQEEARNVGRAVVRGVALLRAGGLSQPDRGLQAPRTK